jgi:hypothetical protein
MKHCWEGPVNKSGPKTLGHDQLDVVTRGSRVSSVHVSPRLQQQRSNKEERACHGQCLHQRRAINLRFELSVGRVSKAFAGLMQSGIRTIKVVNRASTRSALDTPQLPVLKGYPVLEKAYSRSCSQNLYSKISTKERISHSGSGCVSTSRLRNGSSHLG